MAKGIPYAWTPEIEQFVRENVKGVMYKDLAAILKEKFDFDVPPKALSQKCRRMNCVNGLDGRFKPGNISYNKGRKGQWSPGSEKGWFKKGNVPHTHKSVGSERINVDGYYEIKVAEPRKWRLKHQVLWEQENGPIPENHVVIFRDGNSLNCVIDNLMLVSKRELMVMNRFRLSVKDAELRTMGHQTAKLIIAIQDKKTKS